MMSGKSLSSSGALTQTLAVVERSQQGSRVTSLTNEVRQDKDQ